MEPPPEWVCRDNLDAGLARAILRMCAAEFLGKDSSDGLGRIMRWVSPALFGDIGARVQARLAAAHAWLSLQFAVRTAPHVQLAARFKTFIAALIHRQRLHSIAELRSSRTEAPPPGESRVLAQSGFYPVERNVDVTFRWSETEAAIRIGAPPGRLTLRLKCAPVRNLTDQLALRFYFDAKPLPPGAVSSLGDGFELKLVMPTAAVAVLGWICRPYAAPGDSRLLGLPITQFAFDSPAG